MSVSDKASAAPGAGYRGFVLAMLFLVYAFNFLDRQIIAILAIPIQAELGLDDRQMGLLGGIAFAALYSVLGVPIAWLADRTSRTWIITVSLTAWSGFTALCGLAQNFWQLFAARVGVGVGEAGGVAPSYSLIADYFPPGSRAGALAIYSLGIPVGSACGVYAGALIAGGALGADYDWRSAFIFVGVAGVVLAPLFRLAVREPRRGGLDIKAPAAPAVEAPASMTSDVSRPSFAATIALLARKPTFWLLALGASCSSMMGYGVFFWMPSFFARTYGLGIVDTGWIFGTIVLIGGGLGIFLGGILGDRLGRASKKAYVRVPAIAFFLTMPFYLIGVMAPSPIAAFFLFLIPTGLGLAWAGPTLSVFQQLVPPSMRSVASAVFLLLNNLLGIGVGVYVLGELSTLYAPLFGEQSLRYAIMTGASLYLVAGILFLTALRTLDRDWVN
ncbi:MFS transporter [Alkalicaulis satelles]|uniref:MFS transporter n=1 Tax=Alkalicaulis satelles TaxID=2609175 RepID=A0A5M6ZM50_9PROT|nr:MFS transporter [Alkalicaulis satelles]KAA5805390.1 MFS transporter [Alkalicaulis satelles]